MAQIIKHRRGSLEGLASVTSSINKGELVIATGSSNLSVSNGSSIVFAAAADGQLQAVNRILVGTSAPANFANSTYNGLVSGVPFYDSTSGSLYILGTDTNTKLNLIGNINSFSQSVDSRLDSVEASLGGGGDIGNSVTQLNTFTGSATIRLNNLESTSASVNISVSNLNAFSASENTKSETLRLYTASVDTKFSTLQTLTASLAAQVARLQESTASLNLYTSSLRTAFTASGANVIFSGDVTIPGNLTVTGTQTIVNSTTVQIGDNILELNGTGTANGGLLVKDPTSPNTLSGSLLWDSTLDYWKAGAKDAESKILLAGGDSVVTSSAQVVGILQSLNSFSASENTKSATLALYTASVDTKFTTLQSYTASIDTKFTTLQSLTASNSTRFQRIEESTSSLNAFSASENTKSETLRLYTASVDTKFTTLQSYTASIDTKFTTLQSLTASNSARFTRIEESTASLNSYTSSNDTTNTAQNSRLTNIESFTSSFGTSFSSSVDSILDTLEGTGTIQGVGTGNQVTFAKVTTTGDVVVGGDLVVQGNTVTLNTAQLVVEDKLISLASGSTNAATANGAGIQVLGANATFTYDSTPNAWTANIPISASAVTASVNVPGFGSSKRVAFRATTGNLDFVAAPTTSGDLVQWDGANFVMSNVIDGGTF